MPLTSRRPAVGLGVGVRVEIPRKQNLTQVGQQLSESPILTPLDQRQVLQVVLDLVKRELRELARRPTVRVGQER